MPKKPKTFDPRRRTPQQRTRDRNKHFDKRRERNKPWRKWYRSQRWKDLRQRLFTLEPACRKCRERGMLTPATVADHIKAHNGDPFLFWDFDNVQPLCDTCHSADKQREERKCT